VDPFRETDILHLLGIPMPGILVGAVMFYGIVGCLFLHGTTLPYRSSFIVPSSLREVSSMATICDFFLYCE